MPLYKELDELFSAADVNCHPIGNDSRMMGNSVCSDQVRKTLDTELLLGNISTSDLEPM